MLKKINNPEIITVRQAREKYTDNYIGIKIIKQNFIIAEDSEGIVLYTADNFKEQWIIPRENDISVVVGYNIGDYPGGSFRLVEGKLGE